jgi:hypothetical protein
MGIDLKGARRVIHFGPSQTVESYLQECGRVGRDGGQSECILLHNGLLAAHCSGDMKDLIRNENKCRRREILKHFSGEHKIVASGCKCCDVCAQDCSCSGVKGGCSKKFLQDFSFDQAPEYKYNNQRTVTAQQREDLRTRLFYFRDTLRNGLPKQVIYSNIHLEFGRMQIHQIMQNVHKLFSIADIMNCTEIWRSEHANSVLEILSNVFEDISKEELDNINDNDFNDLDETVDLDWVDIRDDSSVQLMSFDESSYMQMSQEHSMLEISTEPADMSIVIRDIAKELISTGTNDEDEL